MIKLAPRALSPDGYIINQSYLSDIRYGCRYSDYNGCGWIAAYNLLKCCGRRVEPSELIANAEKCLYLRGIFGTDPFRLRRMLNKKYSLGLKLRLTRGADLGNCGILFYFHRHGAHFVAYTQEPPDCGAGVYRFFNASGAALHLETAPSLLKRKGLLHLALALYR